MSQESLRILTMLAEGKITVAEADQLLQAVSGAQNPSHEPQPPSAGSSPRYLHIHITDAGQNGGKPEEINVRIPLQLVRAGIKLKSLLPEEARDKITGALHDKGISIDLNDLRGDSIEELLAALSDLSIDINQGEGKVRIFCE